MSLILIIDTSSEKASIAIGKGGKTIYQLTNQEQKDHASWIHEAIASALAAVGETPANLEAVGVTSGPGSYTGLRVGMATAKGMCYALQVPLITVNTLEAMTHAVLREGVDLYCPLIDARRMEVYTALYDRQVKQVLAPYAIILDEHFLAAELSTQRVLFFGSGREKVQKIISHDHAIFEELDFEAAALSSVVNEKFNLKDFTDLTYSEPVYVKEVYINTLKKS